MIENEYGIKTKPASPGKQQENAIIEIIHLVIGNLAHTYNLQETYIDDANPWIGILATSAFAVRSTYHMTKDKIPGQLVFGRDMILPINQVADCRYIRQRKQAQIYKDVIRENTTRIDHHCGVRDRVMKKSKSACKYETPFKGPYGIFHTWTNGTVTLRTGAVTTIINIRNIKPYCTLIVEGQDPA